MIPIHSHSSIDVGILTERLRRLVSLDTSVFEEVRDDPAATTPSVFVAIAATFIAGLGGWVWWLVQDFGDSGKLFFQSVILGSLFSLALWIVWLFVAWAVLTQVFREETDWQQMLRTMGLATAPLALSGLMFIPAIDFGIALASVALFFGLTSVAIQAVTTANPARALVANLAGFAVWAIVLTLLVGSDTWLAPGIFVFDAPVEALSDLASFAGNFEVDVDLQ